MTQRLPIVGGDNAAPPNDWGTILNGFLGVSHNSDGTLNASATVTALGSAATSVSFNGQKITNIANGSASTDAVAFGQLPTALPPNGSAGGDLTGSYPNPTLTNTSNVQSIVSANLGTSALLKTNNLSDVSNAGSSRSNIHVPALTPAVAATTGNISISSAPATVDNVTPSSGDIILLTQQSTSSQNGPWVYNGSSSALTRPTEFPSAGSVKGRTCQVSGGTTYANTIWSLDVGPGSSITIDTTSQSWSLLTPLVTANVTTPPGMSFLAQSQLATTTSPLNTRRATLGVSTGAGNTSTGYADVCARWGFTLSVTPTRVRFKIRNSDLYSNSTISQALSFTGIWWGTPNSASETAWQGDFTVAPTQLTGSFTVDPSGTGAEYVSGWFTPPTSAVAHAFQAVSVGFTVSSDSKVYQDDNPGWCWHSATNVGCSTAASAQAAPGVGTASPHNLPLDIRMEYEFVGDNQIGLFLGDSLSAGYLGNGAQTVPIGKMGPDSSWPQMAVNRLNHVAINGSVGGIYTSIVASTSSLAWTRFDLGPGVNSGVSCTPDYAVIALGANDPYNIGPYLPQSQSNMQTIISNLQAAGISRIFVCTVPPLYMPSFGYYQGFQAGILKIGLSAGALGTVDLVGPVTSTTAQGGAPGGGNPGTLSSWYNAITIITVTLCTINSTTTVTVTSGGFPNVSPGFLVTGTNITNGTQVATVSGNTLTLSKPATGSATETLTFNPNGIYFELQPSGVAEGPFPLSAASGTTTLALTAAGTTVNAHTLGGPVFTLIEGFRQNLNAWLRSGVPGTLGTIDFDALSFMPGKPSVVAVGDPSVPFSQQHWLYYSSPTAETHPTSPGLYQRWAREFVAGLTGV